jgi:hypothetical protein
MLEKVTPEKVAAWREDLQQIKKLGFNTVRCWVEWTAAEAEPGTFDFSALETVADLAAEVGLKVIVQVYMDSAPDWVGATHPDASFVAANGLAVKSQSSPGYCFDHAGVREKVLAFFAAPPARSPTSPHSTAGTSGASLTSSTGPRSTTWATRATSSSAIARRVKPASAPGSRPSTGRSRRSTGAGTGPSGPGKRWSRRALGPS